MDWAAVGILAGAFGGITFWVWLCVSIADDEWWTPMRERARQCRRKED